MAERNDKSDDGKKQPEESPLDALGGFGSFTDGIANLIGKLGDLAAKGEQMQKNGEFPPGKTKDVQGSYGFSMKFASADNKSSETQVQPFAKQRPPAEASVPKVEDREPHVDVFPEAEHLLVVAEMPGVAKENIHVDFEGKTLTLTGKSSRVRFSKQVELPQEVAQSDVELSINNGVVELRLQLAQA